MIDLDTAWPFILSALLFGSSLVAFARSPKQSVRIERPTLSDPVASPTLARSVPVDVLTEPTPALLDGPSELTQLKGVGPKLASLLAAQGVRRIDQVAAWNADQVAALDTQLGNFAGRIERDRLVEQAQLLQHGDIAAYEAAFGKRTEL